MQRYPSRRSPVMGAILWSPVVLLAVGTLLAWLGLAGVDPEERWILLILLVGISLVMYGLWTGIEYWLQDGRLHLRLSLFRFKIPLSAIQRIERSNYPVVGIRMGLAFKGLRIHWGTGYTLFISPEDEEGFLREIKDQRPDLPIELT